MVWPTRARLSPAAWRVKRVGISMQWNPDNTSLKGLHKSAVLVGCRMTGARVNAGLVDGLTGHVG